VECLNYSKLFVECILHYRLHKFTGRLSQSSAVYDKLRLMYGHSFAYWLNWVSWGRW